MKLDKSVAIEAAQLSLPFYENLEIQQYYVVDGSNRLHSNMRDKISKDLALAVFIKNIYKNTCCSCIFKGTLLEFQAGSQMKSNTNSHSLHSSQETIAFG